MNELPAARSVRWWAYGALALWIAGAAFLLNRSAFGIDESAARVLLLIWSFVEDLANPIVTLGVPDVRAVFLIPAGFAFPGSVFAAKVMMLVVVAATAMGLLRWFEDRDSEGSMIATGLWLLSPLLIEQVDRLAVAPFLVFVLLAAAALDRSYRASPLPFGGRYFTLMLLSWAAATLHPAGVALAVVIVASWIVRPPAPQSQAKTFFAGGARIVLPLGVALSAGFGCWLADGWSGIGWLGNPVIAAAGALFGWAPLAPSTATWAFGGVLCLLAALTLWRQRAKLWDDAFGRMVVAGAAVSVFCGDATWAMFVLLILLYWGFPLLLGLRVARLSGLLGQRGPALALLLVLATLFMSQDRGRFTQVRRGPELSAQDRLIQRVADLVKQSEVGVRVASQWPGRTMVACACNTLPLPPVSADETSLLKMLKGIDLIVFDPRNPINQSLSRNLAVLGGERAETVALEAGGVIVRMRKNPGAPAPEPKTPEAPAAPPAPQRAPEAPRGT